MTNSITKAMLCILIANQATAFMPSSIRTTTKSTAVRNSVDNENEGNSSLLSRSDLFQQLKKTTITATATAALIGLSTTTLLPQPALADVTNKVASKSALRYVKRSIKEFETLEFKAGMNNYEEVKDGLRSSALDEIRKNSKVLIKGGEDGPEAENLVVAYKAFIKGIEKLDSDANLALRGKKNIQLLPSYTQTLKDLKTFADVAERAMGIPVASAAPVEVEVSAPAPVEVAETVSTSTSQE